MKILKTLLISCMLTGSALNASAVAVPVAFIETPVKTIVIKHPEAANADKYFAKSTIVMFEVYKAGSKDDVAKIIKSLQSDSNVESVTEGNLTGDYQAITITLKNNKDKAWFVSQFKKAGLNHIKLNNNPVVEITKL